LAEISVAFKMTDKEKNMNSQKHNPLDISTVKKKPFVQFELWFKLAKDTIKLDPNAMTITTVAKDNTPNSRIVLLKYFDEKSGLRFFTNTSSQKALEIKNNPNVCINFYWPSLGRQIKIKGICIRIKRDQDEQYFANRHYDSQIGAWASKQSQELNSRQILLDRVDTYKKKFPKDPICPQHWGGYDIAPSYFEFWQMGKHRLHDRISYKKHSNDAWKISRLYP
jgi:pyridoxamine 5'-phosphate oxidase